jgi:hypothetical protein
MKDKNKGGVQHGAPVEDFAQQERIERAALSFLESWLTGGGAIVIEPLAGQNVAESVGAISVLNGFTIRLRK